MSLTKATILKVGITISPRADILKTVAYFLSQISQTHLTIVTPNPEQIVYAQSHHHYKELLNSADIALPDGVGIVWAIGKYQISNIKYQIRRITGIDFMEDLIKLAAEKGYPVGLIGGWGNTAERALVNLQKKHSGLKGWAETPGEFQISNFKFQISNKANSFQEADYYFVKLAQRIKESGTRMVFVGLGAPKQEYFIEQLSSQFTQLGSDLKGAKGLTLSPDYEPRTANSLVFMSVGGALDIFAGNIKRAPQLFQRLHLEWLWRLLYEPWRIRRQINLLAFIYLTLKRRIVLQSDRDNSPA